MDNRTEFIAVRLSEKEKEYIEKQAEQTGKSKSRYVREKLFKEDENSENGQGGGSDGKGIL